MSSRKSLILLCTLAVVVLPLTVATAAGGSTPQLYAKGVPVCKAPANPHAHVMTCDAMRRVFVRASAPGARPYTPLSVTSPHLTIGPNGGLTPADLRTAYKLSGTGSGQTVAIVDAYNDPNIAADLATFSSRYGLPSCTVATGCLKIVDQTGSTTVTPYNDTTGWSVEISLDVESVHAICPACKILLVVAHSSQDTDLGAAENYAASHGATEITNSFGGPEGANSTFQAAFNHPGIVITASTGDHGYYDFDRWSAINLPQTPAAFPTVVSVGGTSLYLSSAAARQNETVWNDNGPNDYYQLVTGSGQGAGGGGCSTLFPAKSWQLHVPNWTSTACGTRRLAADVSAIADPLTGFDIYDSYTCASGCPSGPTWMTLGGTSLAAPVVAAIYALAGGARGVQYPALTLYGRLKSAYDVTVGGNGWCDGLGVLQCTYNSGGVLTNPNLAGVGIVDCAWNASGVLAAGNRACEALPGYDGPSGVGAPNGVGMFTKTGPTVTAVNVPATIKHGVSGTYSVTVSDPFPGGTSSPASYTWSWGDGTTTTTSTPSTTHTYAAAASRTITVTFKDAYYAQGVAAASKSRAITVG